MDRRRVLVALLVLLAALALGAGAATLEDADSGGSGFGAGGGAGGGSGSGEDIDSGAPQPFNESVSSVPSYVDELVSVFALLFLLGALYGLVVMYQEYGLVRTVSIFILLIGVSALMAVLLYAIAGGGAFETGTGGLFGDRNPALPGGGNPATDSGTSAFDAPTVALALLFGLALIGALAAFVRSTGDDVQAPPPEAADGETDSRVTALGEAAGAAADRIEGGGNVDNEVFRAWREMTDRLDASNPQATTPAEFARIAVAAGLARDDVEELTVLFEEVRYGDAPATEDRERRAVAALRRIEEAYT